MSAPSGGMTVEIPGGTARLRAPVDMTARQRRPLQVLTATLGMARFQQIVAAQAVTYDQAIDELGLTETEHGLLFRMTDATLFGLLESWTLPAPLPGTVDEVQDIPGPVYDLLAMATAQVMAGFLGERGVNPNGTPVDVFEVDAVEDPASPTGASGGSTASSAPAAARRGNSTRKAPTGGPRTGTRKRSG